MNGVVPTQPIATKATRLLDQHRVYLSRTSPIARAASASPASGSTKVHEKEQRELLTSAFS